MMEEWEQIADHCHRLKVYGGWIVESWAVTGNSGDRIGLCFVPDPQHYWEMPENKTKEGA